MTKEKLKNLIATFIGCLIGSCIGQTIAYIILRR